MSIATPIVTKITIWRILVSKRPPIPAEIKRRVLVEAGHRCAIPACRFIEVDVHHIVFWEECKKHEYDNLIALCPNCHRMAHNGKIDRKSLRIYKANLRFIHDRFSQLEVDILFESYRNRGKSLLWPPFNRLLIKRIIECNMIICHENPHMQSYTGGMRTNPDYITITDIGINYIDSLENIDLN